MRIHTFLIISTATLSACGSQAPDPDREALRAVLTHFHERQDLQGVGSSGSMLLVPDTYVWTRQSLEGFRQNRADECQIPEALYEALYARSATRQLGDVIQRQHGWRMATREQLAPERLLERVSDPSIRTSVSVSAPGFSNDGRQAVVVLSFSTGAHGALARYRLTLEGGSWSVVCSQMNYYL